jgi:hypothetical protein
MYYFFVSFSGHRLLLITGNYYDLDSIIYKYAITNFLLIWNPAALYVGN